MGVRGGESKSPPNTIGVGVFRGTPLNPGDLPAGRQVGKGFMPFGYLGGGPFPGAWGWNPRI